MSSPGLRRRLATASPIPRQRDGKTWRQVGCRHPQNPVYGVDMAVGSTSMLALFHFNGASRTLPGTAVPLQCTACSAATHFPAPVFRCNARSVSLPDASRLACSVATVIYFTKGSGGTRQAKGMFL